MDFHAASPILRVANLAQSIDYFVKNLGFTQDWTWKDSFGSVSRMKCNIMLSVGDQGKGEAWIYVGVADVDKLYDEFKNRGAKIRQEPTNFSWACEMQVEDLDGNIIRFASDSKKDVPFGPWLDMNGKLWS